MTAREKFKKGDRVRLTVRGRALFYKKDPERRGTVIGFSTKADCVSIIVDGNKPTTRTTYHMSYWEVDAPVLTPDVIDECLAEAPAIIKEVEESLKGSIYP